MVDRILILRKLSELDEYLGQLREYRTLSVKRYRSDWKVQRIVERTLQMAIETCLDIAGHIVSDRGWRTPESYADLFQVLSERKAIGRSLLPRLENMAKFRNVVVHHYDQVDPEIVVEILTTRLNDFTAFKKAVLKLVG